MVKDLAYNILDALDKLPSYGEPGYADFVKYASLFNGLEMFLNAVSLLLFGLGCFYVGIVDYTLPPNVRRGFIFAITVFVLAYEFFTFFGGLA